MPPAMSSKAKIEALQTALKKRYARLQKVPDRSIFLHLIYAACLENASHDAADAAMVVLEQQFVDWNEVRVSTPAELSESLEHILPALPPTSEETVSTTVGERIKRALQAVFERKYAFSLDDILAIRPVTNAIAALKGLAGLTPFMVDYVTLHALGGHVIPIDEAALRVLRRLGIIHKDAAGNESIQYLAKIIAKADGLDFATRLHNLAIEFFADPESAALAKFFKSVDPGSVPPEPKNPAPVKKAPAKKQTKKVVKKTAKKTAKKTVEPSRQSATKQLRRSKPR